MTCLADSRYNCTQENYIFVAYIYKINAILIRAMKNRADGSMIEAFTDIYDYLQIRISTQNYTYLTMNALKLLRNLSTAKIPTSN